MNDKPLPTIAELEAILSSTEEREIEIQPDGSILAVPKGTADNQQPMILTSKRAKRDYY